MTHAELRKAAEWILNPDCNNGWPFFQRSAPHELAQYILRTALADDPEPVSAPALRAEPGWTQVAEANCFVAVVGPDRRLRVWPNTGHVELVEKFDAATTLISGGATLGDVRVLAAVLAPRNKE
jgi:hypothetical protein